MVDWHDIKKAFDREAEKAEKAFVENEQQLLKSIADYVCSEKGVSTLQGYKPEEILQFMEKPIPEIKTLIGGNWLSVDDDKFETLIYSLAKKVKKSDNLIPW